MLAAALRQAKEWKEAPEPTAASRRGPFMWRDTTEEVGGTATPSGDLNCEETAHTTAVATPAMVTEDAKPAMFGLLNELHTAVEELTPLPKPLAEVVEEKSSDLLPVTLWTFYTSSLLTFRRLAPDSLHIGEIEARLLKNKITHHTRLMVLLLRPKHLNPKQRRESQHYCTVIDATTTTRLTTSASASSIDPIC